jgi:hypothetical protein
VVNLPPVSRGLRLGLVGLLAALCLGAGPLRREEVPEPLAPWVDWVLRGHEPERCPPQQGHGQERICLWPARLHLALDAGGGRFEADVLADAPGALALPGDAGHWPQDVLLDGEPAPVVEAGGRPALRLAPGPHRVAGRFVWGALPQVLAVPGEVALVALAVDGQPVAFPVRDAEGRLWLGRRAAGTEGETEGEESRVEVEVHRRVADEVPLRLSSLVELTVSGPARELTLGPALPAGFVPLALAGALPARVEPDGRLRVQVRPGAFVLLLEARSEGPPAEIGPPARPEGGAANEAEPWDDEEVWVFDARPALRLVDVEGGTPVDPQQTRLPDEWKALPAWRLAPGEALRLVERRRGDAEPTPDRLELERAIHLDFDGRGATVSDRITGVVRTRSRLEMGAGSVLGRAAVNGVEQFVTRRAGAEQAGFEVPRGEIAVSADLRVEGDGRLARIPAVGWDQDFAGASGRLELPPGWRLLHAFGVDRAEPTWLNRWTLLDLFIVLVVAMALLRLWGPLWGGLALVTLALTYTEPGAPRGLWLAVAVAEALRGVAGTGRLGRAVELFRAASLALLVLVAVPFAVGAVRAGLFPALERPFALEPGAGDAGGVAPETAADAVLQVPAAAPPEPAAARESLRGLGYVVEEGALQAGSAEGKVVAKRSAYAVYPDPAARITTGPGVPSWRWTTVQLLWSGPVERGQEMRLLLLSPGANAALAVLRVALLTLLVLRSFGVSPGGARSWLGVR